MEQQPVALRGAQEELVLVHQIRQKDRQREQEQQVVVDWQGQGELEAVHTYSKVAAEEEVVVHTFPLPEELEVDRTYPWQEVVVAAVDPSFPSVVAAVEAERYSSQAYSQWGQEEEPGRRQRPMQKDCLDRQVARNLEHQRATQLERQPQIGRKDCSWLQCTIRVSL